MSQCLRWEVFRLYKQLLHLGREYPKGYQYFRKQAHAIFSKNRDVNDPNEIRLLIQRGQYVVKELEALYMLRKYRVLKQRYYGTDGEVTVPGLENHPKNNNQAS
ncbi:LYR motif-containing protein 5 [Fasciola gigantica]|uniref:LYR motif-containing protein 5 n=1 Tax=Fasciola gigantica TaxID=46835 RepID=A0A504YR47_FASGI|nr:LYR motif-containing protein 5 [Fasciola gigantica]